MLRRSLALLSMLILCTSLVIACTAKDSPVRSNINNLENSNNPASNHSEPETDYANMKAEVTFGTIFSDDEFEKNIGSYVKEKFPNYTINHLSYRGVKLEELVTAGINFDVYVTRANGFVNSYEPIGLAYDMTELVHKHELDLSVFDSGYVESGIFDNKLYGLPIFNDSLVLYYNRDLFDRFSVPYPRDGMTWEETLKIARQLDRNEGGTQYMGLWMSPKHYFRMNSLSQGFIDSETNQVTVNNENWRRVFEIFAELSKHPGVREMANENFPAHDHFRGGSPVVGMYVFITEWIAVSEAQLPLNWDMVSMPVFKDHPNTGTQPYANYVGITSVSKNQDAAMQVIKYLVSEEYQTEISKKGKITPLNSQAVKDAAFADHPHRDKHFSAVYINENAPMRELHQLEDLVIEVLNTKVAELVKGQQDVATALREAQDEAQHAVDEALTLSN